ncbi:MAG: PAS domain-containing protein [Desulfobacteraceae bacterium]|nr:PAS domain-containing protein [Desulfobacteraceae bacterium]
MILKKKYRSLFDLAREGIVLISNDDGSILDFNPEFLRQTGFDADTIRTKKYGKFSLLNFRKKPKKRFFRFRESHGGLVSWKLCQHHENDEMKILPVEIVAQRMMVENRDVIMCMVRDTSEREAMIRALSLASEEWRRCFDAIGDVIIMVDQDFKISRANLAASRLLKTDPRAIIGKNCHQLFHGMDRPPEYCPLLKACEQGIYCEEEQAEPHLGRAFVFSLSPMKDETGKITHSVEVISDVTERRKYETESLRLGQTLASSFKGITIALSDLVESRDPYTAGHSRHVAEMAVMIGKEIGLSADELEGLHICGILHDIGKVTIPAAILNRPGKLSTYEWGMTSEHTTTAYDSLRHIPFPWPVADVVYQHHERLDGSGYPRGLKGDQIHPWSLIIGVADVVDAMTSHRPYRPGLPRQIAIDELERGRGMIYDPRFVDALIRSIHLEDKRIMIIDTESELLSGIVRELGIEGFEASGYNNPKEALAAFENKPFPLVITELYLPGTDGVQISLKIREISPTTEIIVITKYTSKEETLRVLRSGASDFLEKPLDLEIFIKSVHRAMRRFKGKKL